MDITQNGLTPELTRERIINVAREQRYARVGFNEKLDRLWLRPGRGASLVFRAQPSGVPNAGVKPRREQPSILPATTPSDSYSMSGFNSLFGCAHSSRLCRARSIQLFLYLRPFNTLADFHCRSTLSGEDATSCGEKPKLIFIIESNHHSTHRLGSIQARRERRHHSTLKVSEHSRTLELTGRRETAQP